MSAWGDTRHGRHRGEPKRPAPCPWPGCSKRARPGYPFCRAHWRQLPAGIRIRVLAAYRPGQAPEMASPEYRQALSAALAYARLAERGLQ